MSDTIADLHAKQHPGFTITCDQCGSAAITIENSLGFSAESGGWGSIDLVCDTCDSRATIVES